MSSGWEAHFCLMCGSVKWRPESHLRSSNARCVYRTSLCFCGSRNAATVIHSYEQRWGSHLSDLYNVKKLLCVINKKPVWFLREVLIPLFGSCNGNLHANIASMGRTFPFRPKCSGNIMGWLIASSLMRQVKDCMPSCLYALSVMLMLCYSCFIFSYRCNIINFSLSRCHSLRNAFWYMLWAGAMSCWSGFLKSKSLCGWLICRI